jgi:hypothetical protein
MIFSGLSQGNKNLTLIFNFVMMITSVIMIMKFHCEICFVSVKKHDLGMNETIVNPAQ